LVTGSTVRFAGIPMFFVSALPPLMPGLPNCCRNFPSLVNFSSCASFAPLPASHTTSL